VGALVVVAVTTAGLGACSSGSGTTGSTTTAHADGSATTTAAPAATATPTTGGATSTSVAGADTTSVAGAAPSTTSTTLAPVRTIEGMPPVVDPANIYSEAGAGRMSPATKDARAYVYVPSNDAGSVTVIDQASFEIVKTYGTGGKLVQHVVPGYDMSTLYANVSGSNFLRAIDPTTGDPGDKVPVDAPYNLYWTPDGTRAVVMAERLNRIDFYDRTTWKPVKRVPVPCTSQFRDMHFGGVNHADWSADGSYFLATCEFAGKMIKVDTTTMEVIGEVELHGEHPAMPQDVRTPDGRTFYVADMMNGGLWVIDGATMTVTARIATGVGAHGIYPSRDGTRLYVANRGRMKDDEGRRSRPGEGSVSVVDWKTNTVTATWPIDGGGSPDMGGVSADGKLLWLSGRYDAEVYVFDTATGALAHRIKVASSPHGLCVWPQPGRYALGHTGNTR
jgi:YVTN family beta-propeller protein